MTMYLCLSNQNMMCARELISLLLNLFPTHLWNISTINSMAKESMDDFDSLENAIIMMENSRIRMKSIVRPEQR